MSSHLYTRRVALLLFGSGYCALVYQVAWLRMLRLVFGASTASTAAVLAIFMGGLGLGALVLGRRADRSGNPLGLYAALELGIGIAAAVSPLLIVGVQRIYTALGGSWELGVLGGSAVRLLLSGAVLGAPTFLMGGTLPATARAVTRAVDRGRRSVALLYGLNTLGAVVGALSTTFCLIELLGLRKTVLIAALLNLIIALAARSMSRARGCVEAGAGRSEADGVGAGGVALWAVLFAAAAVGFVFFLMELVWYRMMGPILGGSTYTFGIILAVALLGVGVGGLVYAAVGSAVRPTPVLFAASCAVEALCVAVPLGLGDDVALLALELRGLQAAGFGALAVGWTMVVVVVVLPPAVVAGFQFPLLIALLGGGSRRVGREVGLTYAWNTLGAIGGSIAGGFGLLPMLTAPGAWRLSVLLLVATAAVFVAQGSSGGISWRRAALPVGLGVGALLMSQAAGPSAFWRHSGIGAGRFSEQIGGPNELRDIQEGSRRAVVWETDGRESSVALVRGDDYAFYINGKSDGAARSDAPTTVMSVLIGALLHPEPTAGLVIGLGSGASAGWMAQVEGVKRVDVVELEPAVLRVAQACAAVNWDALSHPKIETFLGDGREFLLTTDRSYDLVFSEPSNPYRAGISSLFTRGFYRAAAGRLRPGGIFLQWLQGYEVDAQVVRTAYATLGSVFPWIETWQVHAGDLLLVASRQELVHDAARLRRRLAAEPFRSALPAVWGVHGLEGLYSGFVASPALASALRSLEGDRLNTDDHPIIEFGFARNLGRSGLFSIDELRRLAQGRGEDRPLAEDDGLDWREVEDLRSARALFLGRSPVITSGSAAAVQRSLARDAYGSGELASALALWDAQDREPSARIDMLLVAEALAEAGDERAPAYADRYRAWNVTEAEALLARWCLRQERVSEAAAHLLDAFRRYRSDAWPWPPFMRRALSLTEEVAEAAPELGRRLFEALGEPFAGDLLHESRLRLRLSLAGRVDFTGLCGEAFRDFEPHVPWTRGYLELRLRCYESSGHPLASAARTDLQSYTASGPPRLGEGLSPTG